MNVALSASNSSRQPMSLRRTPLLFFVCLRPMVNIEAPGSWVEIVRKVALARFRHITEPKGASGAPRKFFTLWATVSDVTRRPRSAAKYAETA